jgi:hypothetical protein
MNYEEERAAVKTIESAIKNFYIIDIIFKELRVSESIELGVTGLDCDCWLYCECHNENSCLNKKDLCSDGHDHSFTDCDNNCGVECECECTHTEQIVISNSIKYYTTDYGTYHEINPVQYAEVYAIEHSCQYCRYGCERCKWINSLLKISDLPDDIIKGISYTAEVLADDAYNAGDRCTLDPQAEDYLTALALDGINIEVNKLMQV